jgi:ADP-ribose pyrophosphatase YjhB (NUDIX family)
MPTYFEVLRERVGDELLLIPRVRAIVLDARGAVLLVRRRDDPAWELPGSELQLGETVRGSLRRALRERLAIETSDERLFTICSGAMYETTDRAGKPIAPVTAVFTARAGSSAIVGPSSELGFFAPDSLPDEITRSDRRVLDEYRAGASYRGTFVRRATETHAHHGASDYIASIRRHIGHEVLLLPTTATIALDDEGALLLQRRADGGGWSCPGGIVEAGETVAESAARELEEETGLIAREFELFGIFSGNDFTAEYPNGDRTAVVQFVYLAHHVGGRLAPDAESTELRYIALDALPREMPPSHAGFLRHLPAHLAGRLTLPIVP